MLFIGEHYVSGKEDVRNVLAQLLGIDQYDVDDIVSIYCRDKVKVASMGGEAVWFIE